MKNAMLRYKDPALRSRQFVWLRGRDAWNNFMLERASISKRTTMIGSKRFRVITSMSVC